MTISEKTEVSIIVLVCLTPFIIGLPNYVSTANLVLWSAALLLVQSLIRDLSVLWQRQQITQSNEPPRKEAACLCAESAIGITGVIIGCALVLARIGGYTYMNALSWSALALAMLSIGYFLKSYVLQWNPWKIVKEPNHLSIVVKWS